MLSVAPGAKRRAALNGAMSSKPTAPWRVGIIGLGRIAEGYDEPCGPAINTHIKACLGQPRLSVAAICDTDAARAQSIATRWGLTAEICTPAGFWAANCDIICVATPDEAHADMMHAALEAKPRIVLCEKPLTLDIAVAREIVARAQAKDIVLAVNFLRRWLPGVGPWIAAAHSGKLGRPLGARLVYSRGWRHNACHGMDLIGAALGDDCRRILLGQLRIPDFSANDPTLSAFLEIQSGNQLVPVQVLGIDGREQTVFDVEISFSEGRLRVWDEDGMRVCLDTVAALPGGFAPELRRSREHHDSPPAAMGTVWSNLADHLASGAPVNCSGNDVLAGLSLIDAVDRARDAA